MKQFARTIKYPNRILRKNIRKRANRMRQVRKYDIGLLISSYVKGIIIFVLAGIFSPALALLAYPIVGIYLSRKLESQIVWHPLTNNLYQISNEKIRFIFAWPTAFLSIIFRLLIAKYL